MADLISFDAKNFFDTAVGDHGASKDELAKLAPRLEKSRDTVLKDWESGKQGWLGVPDEAHLADEVQATADFFLKKRMKTCLVIGIGGSDLGARAAYAALGSAKGGMRLLFAGGNTDPVELSRVLADLDPRSTVVNIVSKSGDTVEPMASFLVIRDLFRKKLGAKRHREHIVATTDLEKGAMNKLTTEEGYAMLPVPNNIGGRFSVLSPVGLFPLACAGVDIKAMLRGAKQVRDRFVKQDASKNDACAYAALQYLADFHRGQSVQVLMPYSAQLAETGKWFRQLWAESLGKKRSPMDDEGVGPTPVAALGATDQHSQVQLYMEGPRDKTVTFIEVKNFAADVRIPAGAKDVAPLAYLAGTPLSKIIHAERAATAKALKEAGRPNATLTIPTVSPESLGALFLFFEIATGVAGGLYGIDPYDQPGVEAGKKAMYHLLGRPGF